MPEGYRGVIVQASGTEQEASESAETGEGDEEELREVKVLEGIGSFDEIVAWGHESFVDDDDAFVKGMEEWIGFSQAVSRRNGLSNGLAVC